MILIFGGTTEGRRAATLVSTAMKPFFYSTRTKNHLDETSYIQTLSGEMQEGDILSFCKANDIRLIIDASHPFARNLHDNISTAAKQLSIPTIRYDRFTEKVCDDKVSYFPSLEDTVSSIAGSSYKNIVALTGVSSASRLLPLLDQHKVYLRIMDKPSSWQVIEECAFPKEQIILFNEELGVKSEEFFSSLINPELIIIKENGAAGGFGEKVDLAKRLGIDLFIIERPTLPLYADTVYGEHGLRQAIDTLLPGFFKLRTGFTTGAAATAASAACLMASLTKTDPTIVRITLPSGELFTIPIHSITKTNCGAVATVIKDAGDDPDVTNGLEICAKVDINPHSALIKISSAEGIGIVTLPGLGIPIGEGAINEVPRRMILENALRIARENSYTGGIHITLSVPKGKEIAKHTFNARLGIIGGISILGTSGIVTPFSNEAFLESIRRQIQIVKALKHRHIIINSGAKSENSLKDKYPNVRKEQFIHYGNLIGDTLSLCEEEDIPEVTLGVMIGKAVKLAAGDLDTHSKRSSINRLFLIEIAQQLGYDEKTTARIQQMTVARELWNILPDHHFFDLLKKKCYDVCRTVYNKGKLNIELIDEVHFMERR